jgi:uncharacterized glyoxalase superfamily protein PhnB
MFNIETTQHLLAVKNLQASEQYFINKLGFKVRFRVDGWCFLSLQSFHVMLGHCPDEVTASETHNHSYFAYVNCQGIDQLYQQYKSRGMEFTQQISDKPWGLREFGVSTPEGHRIMFGQELE